MTFELPWDLYTRYNNYVYNGQSALLQNVSSSIKTTYSSSTVGADGQVVAIAFTDGINFEVVPVFPHSDGSYTFPDANSGGKWRTTNPKPEIQAIKDRNLACNGNLIALARMMRSWKLNWFVPIGGLLIDTIAYQFITNWEYKDKSYSYYDWMCRDFFNWLSQQSESQEYWKAPGSGQFVYRKESFQHRAKRCYNLAIEAINYETSNVAVHGIFTAYASQSAHELVLCTPGHSEGSGWDRVLASKQDVKNSSTLRPC